MNLILNGTADTFINTIQGIEIGIAVIIFLVAIAIGPLIILYHIVKAAVKNGIKEALNDYNYRKNQQHKAYKEAQEKAKQAEENTSKTPKPESIQDMLFKK